jgi:hypothetical protein
MAQDVDLAESAVSAAVHRPTLLGELELLVRQESVVGGQATWAQHLYDVARLRRLGGWRGRVGGRRHRTFDDPARSAELNYETRLLSQTSPAVLQIDSGPHRRTRTYGGSTANLAVDLPVQTGAKTQVVDNRWERLAEREGFDPDSDTLSDQQVTDSENNSVPRSPQKAP